MVSGLTELGVQSMSRLRLQFPNSNAWIRQDLSDDFSVNRRLHGLLMWTISLCHSPLLPNMQSEETMLSMTERITTAMADLDSIDIF